MNATEREKAAKLVTRAIVELSTALQSILDGLELENDVEGWLRSAAASADLATDYVTGDYEAGDYELRRGPADRKGSGD